MPATDTKSPKAMAYHGPGWSLDLTVRDKWGAIGSPGPIFQLWAPQDGSITDPHAYAEAQDSGWAPRLHWAASWQSPDGDDGDYVSGESAGEVLAIVEPTIRAAFEAAIATAARP